MNSGAINFDWATIPRGVPLGIASGGGDFSEEQSIYVADPLNATIWRVINNGGVAEIKNIRGDIPAFVIGKCVDGPATFATWGAPMDVAIDQTGTVYVADAGCNSIRVIKDAGFGQDLDGLVGSLREFVNAHQSRISAVAAQQIEENLRCSTPTPRRQSLHGDHARGKHRRASGFRRRPGRPRPLQRPDLRRPRPNRRRKGNFRRRHRKPPNSPNRHSLRERGEAPSVSATLVRGVRFLDSLLRPGGENHLEVRQVE